jgi:hypothetical protein
MKLHESYLIILAVVLVAMTSQAKAALTDGPDIIPAPDSVIDDSPGATNDHEQGFNEKQGVLLAAPLEVDDGVFIPAGTWVNSHMIFLNTDGDTAASDVGVVWTFDGPVLGVMSKNNGSLEVASSPILGAAGTTYPAAPFQARGLEAGDGYSVSGNTITVSMNVTEPGDWIRVVTAPTIEVGIDIKPGSFPNSFNINGNGVIPVAVLGSDTLDVTEIDLSTLSFAGLDVRVKGNGDPQCSVKDTNGDGHDDLVCQFVDDPDNWIPDDGTATLTGQLNDGTVFHGTDSINIVP